MARFTTIQKKAIIPYSLKSYFDSYSHEFSRINFNKKLETFRSVVMNGFSIYDLTEKFRKDRSDRYDQDDMKRVLCDHIATLIFNQSTNPIVPRYYQDNSYKEVAEDLDKFVMNPIGSHEFMELFRKKFGLPLSE